MISFEATRIDAQRLAALQKRYTMIITKTMRVTMTIPLMVTLTMMMTTT